LIGLAIKMEKKLYALNSLLRFFRSYLAPTDIPFSTLETLFINIFQWFVSNF